METNFGNQVRTRFAPSPTGYMHIGGLRTALYAYCFAKKNDGKFILRLEDTDLERQVENADTIIFRTLKKAGLVYDEGPDIGGAYGPYVQSQRKAMYMEYALQLVNHGNAYYCFCSKERLKEMYESGATKYDKCCLRLDKDIAKKRAKSESFVIRQNIPTTGTSSFEDCV
ncbi:MAG: glutamate--tRNA ligase, partial [Clostridiales bacterium]|nr:glutamate--tRNA ligase [Clostridiales bacterium]